MASIAINTEIKGWFDRRNLPYTATINEWITSREIDTPKKDETRHHEAMGRAATRIG